MGKKSNQARFPVARIKKLIQADEDVGKVAQATPVVVSKCLELFLKVLVDECVKDAEGRGSKKISAYSLKRIVNNVPIFDFCTDIVASVPDPITPAENETHLNGGGEIEAKKRKKRTTVPKPVKTESENQDESETVKNEENDGKLEVKMEKSHRVKEESVEEPEEVEEDEDDDDEEYEQELREEERRRQIMGTTKRRRGIQPEPVEEVKMTIRRRPNRIWEE